ncbi:SDR family oxidoreductase [Sphingobium chlorophenolicum]|uniref:2,4-dienoyl-CoA reductase (NADPH) n=1 Tax=Sphingobium chlorophenolicum TaxID=46429 RepID=A0A081RBR7_SPHCR|nr:SDR family oxidoreductase [Sphingobium chlorophenolicum]KEQ52640.1 2,4-dienoyl-CoA reductase (NADPH) [Sphingobium chlorophenolicum]
MDIFKERIFAGKTVFVAGGSSGINLGIAQRFAEFGARVGLISRKQERISAAAATIVDAGGVAMGIEADVRDYAAVDAALASVKDAYGEIDIVISGAAGNFLSPVVGMSANAFKTVIDIDLLGTFNVLRACYDHIRKPGASIISITAGQAVRPMMFQAHAGAAKAGINNLTQTLAMEWGPAGIRVNAIAPGPIGDTEGMARLAPSDEATAALKGRIALRDYGTKRDIADLALFLCSDNAKYITGAIIDCDGGSVLGDASADALTVPGRA